MRGNLFYSSALEGEMEHLLGAPHYSYRFAEANFRRMFDRSGHPLGKLVMPEYYGTPEALPPGSFNPAQPVLHLIFRSTEQIRLLKFGVNICCFAWEFDVLKDTTRLNEHPFLNQVRMLGLCDEIWVPSEYTRSVLQAHGIASVCIPAPIALPDAVSPAKMECLAALRNVPVVTLTHNFLLTPPENRMRVERTLRPLAGFLAGHEQDGRSPDIYLTVLNPEDFRKNLDSLLRGFHHFTQTHPHAVLIVKTLTSSSRFHLLDVVADVVPAKLASGSVLDNDRIAFFSDYLSNEQMGALYGLADFYLSASIAEGQNLPLLEAMAHGVVPVATANTAMKDYINAGNAIVIHDEIVPNHCEHLAGCIANKPFHIHWAGADDIRAALVASAMSSPEQRQAIGARARDIVARQYSDEAVWARVAARMAEITPEGSGRA